jgi:hypothetical protein
MTAEVGSGINQEKLAGEMLGMGRTCRNHIWFGKMIYRPERGQECLVAMQQPWVGNGHTILCFGLTFFKHDLSSLSSIDAWSGYMSEMEWIHWWNTLNEYTCNEVSTEWIQRSVYVSGNVADPDPGPFWPLDTGSGIGIFRIPIHIFESLMRFFGEKVLQFFVNWPKFFSLPVQK